jgi:hypothetical protein
LLRPLDSLTELERTYLSRLYQVFPKVAVAEALVEEFATILREKDVPGWYAWLHGLEISAICRGQQQVAQRSDQPAIGHRTRSCAKPGASSRPLDG